jgi:CDP-glucose 4,6-dehydratase
MDRRFWAGKKVLLTGHTGFKGSWLAMWLHILGAHVVGYALDPPTSPSLYRQCSMDTIIQSVRDDIRNRSRLQRVFQETQPEVVFHMAAQTLVRESYRDPIGTFEINIMGTVNLLEAVRSCKGVKVVLVITSDKCYLSRGLARGYREEDPLGGYDPYSNSKSCTELVTASYRNSFYNPADFNKHGVCIATARSGNVIGGGDWARDRLIPDCVRAMLDKKPLLIRYPKAIRPWQHILEPLSGYLLLAQKMYTDGGSYAEPWNFGPRPSDSKSVEWIVNHLRKKWDGLFDFQIDQDNNYHEDMILRLDCSKAKKLLGWSSKWDISKALDNTGDWYTAYSRGLDVRKICLDQIQQYAAERGKSERIRS